MELSIIIPVYNTAKYLQRCFDSISPLMTIFSGEIIFVDDGSTDDSPRLMLELSKSHKFVKVLTQSNKGLSGARNTGIKNVKSDCFILLDSDDWINHKNIEDLIRFFLINNLDLLSYRLESFNDNLESLGLRVKHPIPYNTVLSGREFLKEGYQPSSSCLFIYNRNFVINNNLFSRKI